MLGRQTEARRTDMNAGAEERKQRSSQLQSREELRLNRRRRAGMKRNKKSNDWSRRRNQRKQGKEGKA